MRLAQTFGDKSAFWDEIVARHGLRPYRYADIVSWHYGDIVFSTGHDIVSVIGKAWRAGWRKPMGTETMFIDVFERYRRERIVP